MTRRHLFLQLLVFSSGASAIVYQVTWFRQLRLVFGLSTTAHAAVLAVFLGGLGLGGAWLGRRVDRSRRPLAFYGNLELLVALTAAMTPFLLRGVRSLYFLTGGEANLGLGVATLGRLLLTVLVLGAPTFLMGGTLPALGRAVETDEDVGRRRLAGIYGVNTLGGVIGAALATFVLIEALGEVRTLLLAASVTAVVGVAAVRLSRASSPGRESLPPTGTGERVEASPGRAGAPLSFVLAAAAATGFVFFLMELVWYRLLAPILGGTTFSFGLVLALALFGIGAGGSLYALLAENRRHTVEGFAVTCALAGVALGVPLFLGDRIALLALLTQDLGAFGFGGTVLAWTAVAGVVVIPASVVAGYQFPLLVSLLGGGRESVGRHVGQAYAANTLGSILGALSGGFLLLSTLGAVGSWRLCVGLYAALSLVSLLAAALKQRTAGWASLRVRPLPALLIVVVLLLLLSDGPTAAWRHGGIGAGRVALTGDSGPNAVRRFLHRERRSLLWETDGRESSVGLVSTSAAAFVVNGKIDGNAVADAGTQIMSGLLGALLHAEPHTAFVVGLGTGSTAGWLGDVPSMERVDVVELEPAIRRVAETCEPVNRGVLRNPKVHLTFGDAREALLTGRAQYDLVVSEPSNPYRAGIASLFTRDFYRSVRDRLAEDGLFLQWFQAYEVDSGTVAVVLKTLASVFPDVEVWRTMKSDLLLVASRTPVELDLDRLRSRVEIEPFASAMRLAWRTDTAEGVLARHVAGPALASRLSESRAVVVNTDDRNVLEFELAKSLGRDDLFAVEDLLALARRLGADRPRLASSSDAPDWALVERERVGAFLESPAGHGSELEGLLRFHRAWRSERAEEAVTETEDGPIEPRTALERLGRAVALVERGDLLAEVAIAELDDHHPVDTALLQARLRLRRGELEIAVTRLESAIAQLRQDPWVHVVVFRKMFATITEIANTRRDLAAGLEALLHAPFAVERGRELRLGNRLQLAALVDDTTLLAALDAVEPWVPWEGWLLERRMIVLLRAEDPRATQATRDLLRYRRQEAIPLAVWWGGSSGSEAAKRGAGPDGS